MEGGGNAQCFSGNTSFTGFPCVLWKCKHNSLCSGVSWVGMCQEGVMGVPAVQPFIPALCSEVSLGAGWALFRKQSRLTANHQLDFFLKTPGAVWMGRLLC